MRQRRANSVGDRLLMILTGLFLYAPIIILIVFSFNAGNSSSVWKGFSLHWYQQLFQNRLIMHSVYITLLVSLLATVIATVAGGEDNAVYNINADTAAARIAAELGAQKLILMTDIRGLLEDKEDEETLIPVVHVSEVPMLKNQGIISGGMIPKIDCCVEAVRRGVRRAHIIDGRIPHSILIEMLTDEGIGTMFL